MEILVRCIVLAALLTGASSAAGQPATPPESSAGITLAASGLTEPRGFAWAPDGTFFVALARLGSRLSATPPATGTHMGELDGSVVRIEGGCPVVYQGHLPSAGGSGGRDLGPAGLAFVDNQLYVADEGGGAGHGNPLTPDGIYRIDGGGSAVVIADIGAWVRDNPVAEPPQDLDPDGDLTDMVVHDGDLLVVESNSGQILRVTVQGEISRVIDLSDGALRPLGISVGMDDRIYVGMTTVSPEPGSSKVIVISPDGTVDEAWSGLTALVDVAVGPDGALYALEMGNPDADQPLSVAPETGRVVRQAGPASIEEIAININTPVTMAFGPDQGLYVSTPATATGEPSGAVIRLSLDQGHIMVMTDAVVAESPCTGPTTEPDVTPASPPAASPETIPAETPEAAVGVTVSIENYEFVPGTLTVPAGTTVTWTNNDTTAHTVTATDGVFGSGNINPGDTFSFTFTDPGTSGYVCNYHPSMTGSIAVE